MNTYIKTTDSTQFAAVRTSRAELVRVMPEMLRQIVPATKALRRMACTGAIPTYEINANRSLARM